MVDGGIIKKKGLLKFLMNVKILECEKSNHNNGGMMGLLSEELSDEEFDSFLEKQNAMLGHNSKGLI